MDKVLDVPVNLTEADNALVLHAAMPGAEPENISIAFTEDTISVHSTMRGKSAGKFKTLIGEWRIGDYQRVVKLPHPIDSRHVNVTYNNGVLTVSMPKSEHTTPREIKVKKVHGARGQTRGHSGRG